VAGCSEALEVANGLRIEDLSGRWGAFSLLDINLDVRGGEYFVLLGPIASGKTLLLESAAGFHHLSSGRVWLGERDVTQERPERRGIGFVYQHSMLFPHLSVLENVRFGLRFRSLSELEKRQRVDELADLLKLRQLLDRRTANLSGGERQKVALARALAIKPEVLLLDEPLSPLDNLNKEALREQLKALHRQLGTTTVEVTHDQVSARTMADKVGILNGGRLLQTGTMEEVFARPRCRFVAEFLGAENVFTGRAERDGGQTWITLESGLRLLAGAGIEGQVGLCIRPEEVQVSANRPPDAPNALGGRLTDISDRGPMARLMVSAGEMSVRVLVTKPEFRALGRSVGEEIFLAFPPNRIWVFRE
jgi:ABC-type sugar transport system ATPase subunit